MSNTDMSNAGYATTTTTHGKLPGLSWWQAGAIGAVAAALGNLMILFAGRAAGASFEYVESGTTYDVTVGGVLLASVPSLVLGTIVAAVLSRWWLGIFRLAQVIAGALALLTVAGPLMTDTDGGTRLSLALMHVVLGVACVLTLETVRRRVKATSVA